jgi:hypothetical protein
LQEGTVRHLLLLISVLLAGCGQRLEQLFDLLSGHETQTAVLVGKPVTLGPAGIALKSSETIKVIGEEAGVCVVLRTGIVLAPQPEMDRHYQEALSGTKLSSTITLKSGQVFQSSSVAQSWSKYGKVTSGDEMAACLSCACGPMLPVGSEVSKIEVKSSSPIRVLGMYWESTNAFDKLSRSN